MTNIAPWHDTMMHDCDTGGGRGPVVPVTQERPHEARSTTHVKCAACGADWIETNLANLARIWWSKGAWDAEKISYPEGVSDGRTCGHGEERDRVVAWLRESVGSGPASLLADDIERGRYWKETIR